MASLVPRISFCLRHQTKLLSKAAVMMKQQQQPMFYVPSALVSMSSTNLLGMRNFQDQRKFSMSTNLNFLKSSELKQESPSIEENPDAGKGQNAEIGVAHVVRIQGLPFSATSDDIVNFFSESKIAGGKDGIHMMVFGYGNKTSNTAVVEFDSDTDLKKALEKQNEHIGDRYIEVFQLEGSEMEWVRENTRFWQSGYGGFPDKEAVVRLGNLPFGCSKEEIVQFLTQDERTLLRPTIRPEDITFNYQSNGLSAGDAFVQFLNKDSANEAMERQNGQIGERSIKIFKFNQDNKGFKKAQERVIYRFKKFKNAG